METKKITALDEYINKVYTIVLAAVPGACQAAGILYTCEKLLGLFPTVNWFALILFDVTCLLYLAIGVFFIRTGYREKIVCPRKLKHCKIFLVLIMFTQFNYILYLIPSTEFWAFAFLFTVAMALFLDSRMVLVTGAEIAVSLIVSWVVRGDVLMPVHDALFVPNMVNRCVCVLLSLAFIWLLTWLVQHFLINAKKEEIEKNNDRVHTMLRSVSELSERLVKAGDVLQNITLSESSSAEELSKTSEHLLANNTALREKSEVSIENLNELQKWEDQVKQHMIECLRKRGCRVTALPASTSAGEVLSGGYDGVMLSNGPGDPAENTAIIEELKTLYASDIPLFGVCLGHQLLALATGARTGRLAYGHRGGNHPVRDLAKGRVFITSQNHGYMVLSDSVDPSVAEVSHVNVNDGTCEGLNYKRPDCFTTQFHPEANAGPRDTEYLFNRFIDNMAARKSGGDK